MPVASTTGHQGSRVTGQIWLQLNAHEQLRSGATHARRRLPRLWPTRKSFDSSRRTPPKIDPHLSLRSLDALKMHFVAEGSSVDVVVPTRDTCASTARCLEALLRTEPARSGLVKCVLVDNGSSDGTVEFVRSRWPSVDVLRNERNAGFGEACNQGAERGRGSLILFLNSDVFARPGAIERLVSFLGDHRVHVAAGGRLVDIGTEDTQRGFVLRAFPRVSTQVAQLIGLERFWPTNPISRRHLMLDFDYLQTQDVDAQPAGACLICRRSDFEAIEGFDENFYYWFEDVDLVRRLRARGRIAYVHDAVFEHVGGETFAQWRRPEVVVTRYSSLLWYFAKHHSRRDQLVLRAAVAALAAARAVPLLLVDRDRARAYASVLRLAMHAPHLATGSRR
jgi:N-acetylglucosaminyl-diphospho-decaprenol L-rhamnosyltransferase